MCTSTEKATLVGTLGRYITYEVKYTEVPSLYTYLPTLALARYTNFMLARNT